MVKESDYWRGLIPMEFESQGVVYKGSYLSILKDSKGVEFVQMEDEVLVVPLTTEGDAILTIEPSSAFNEPVLILPGGEIKSGEQHYETANRELEEEIGYKAKRLDFLGELRPFSKYLRVRSFVYLARDLTPSYKEGDEGYSIQLLLIPIDKFQSLIASHRPLDARVIASLLMVYDFLKGEKANGRSG